MAQQFTMYGKLSATDRIKKAIITLQEKQPFFAHISLALRLIPLDEESAEKRGIPKECKTAAVDAAGNLYYWEDFVTKLTDDEVMGVVVHETLHPAFQHLERVGGRMPKLANIAQDMVVNMFVYRAGFKLPKGVIPVDTSKDTSWIEVEGKNGKKKITIEHVSEKWWEAIYEELYQLLDKEGLIEKVTVVVTGDHHLYGDPAGDGTGTEGPSKEFWRQRIAEAAAIAKQRGITPAGMERIVDGLLAPKVAWKSLLRSAVKPYLTPTDMSYRKPNKKSKLLGVYLPTVEREHREVEVVIDTSGSIGQEELKEFLSEVVGIAKSANHVKMHVNFCDSRVYEDGRYEVSGPNIPKILAMKPKGGGGTRLNAGLEFIKQKNPHVPVVVVLTDGFDDYEGKTQKDFPFDVIWCLSKGGKSVEDHKKNCLFGRTVKM